MGNHKSLYKTYFNEVYLKKEDSKDHSQRPHSGIDDYSLPALQQQSSSESSRQTQDYLSQKQVLNQQISVQPKLINSGRTTSDISRRQSTKYQKTFKVIIDSNYTLTITVPDRIQMPADDDLGNSSGATFQLPTCGWLIEQIETQYAQLIKSHKQNPKAKSKLRKKLIVAVKTVDKNETIDYWLTQYTRPLKPLPSGLVLEPHYSKIIYNKPKAVCTNDFEMLKVIGKGGFSKVFMVRKKDTGLIYAMKVMKKDQVTNESKLKQIMNERTIMEQLADHPFIIKLHYAFQSKENLHFVLDFCTGGEMFYHLQKNGRFPDFLAKFYFAEILIGIEFLHSKNIVYRDLKPENVLIEVDGHIKLADFGLSKQFKRDERSFSYCGSPEYMCPEILKREGHNHMVDYYTLGAILYEMLTGLPPFYTNNKSEMTKRILDAELTFPSHVNPEAVSLMTALLERNPVKRLGCQRGVEEIKQHGWCKDIDWSLIEQKKITPPWKPRLDQSNFDPEYTQLPLNFDDNFKRALQGDREFSFYYESPCQSLTVTEHSIYASNPDLSSPEIFLQSGSSKKLLEHFYHQQPKMFQNSFMSPIHFNEIYLQQQQRLEMNCEMALKINQTLNRDESILSIEYNQESGLTNFRGFSFFGESSEEIEVKRQLIKYSKLRNKLNRRLKQIQDEEGVIRQSDLKTICLSSPNSSLASIGCQTVLPTPPVMEESSSRNSQPSNKHQMHTDTNSSCSPFPIVQPKMHGIIDKTMKQQLILSRLEDNKEKTMFKSFQTEQTVVKKDNLFRSNIDAVQAEPLYRTQQSLQDSSVQSMKDVSSNDESVAEERDVDDDKKSVHQTKQYPHQNLTTLMDTYLKTSPLIDFADSRELLEESKEEISLNDEQDLKNVKFLLFQSQNVSKGKTKIQKGDKGMVSKQLLKNPKRVATQRQRPGQKEGKQDWTCDSGSSIIQPKGSLIKQNMITQQTSSISNTNTSSRDQQLEKTGTDQESTKHTFDQHSMKSHLKKTFEEENQSAHNENKTNQNEDLDKTTNIMTFNEIQKRNQQNISPLFKRPSQTTIKKNTTRVQIKKPNLEIDIESPQLSQIHLRQGESEYYIRDNLHIDAIRVPQTMKYADRSKEDFNFDQSERSEGHMKSAKQTPKASATGFSFTHQKQLVQTATKKISTHQKQISADFNLMNHDDLFKRSTANTYNAIKTQLTQRTTSGFVTTPKSIKGFSGPSPKFAQQKKPSENPFKNDQMLQELLANSGKKDSVISKGSAKKISTTKPQNTLKKGIPSTASTLTLQRPMDGGIMGPQQKKAMNKPPLSKQTDAVQSSYVTQNSTSKKYSHNSYQKTPTGSKSIINQKTTQSQPGSAKNQQAIKFTFPISEAAQSPKKSEKKIPLPSKQLVKQEQSQKKVSADSDQPRLTLGDSDQEDNIQHTQAVLLKMPKTTMSKTSKKGFFQ